MYFLRQQFFKKFWGEKCLKIFFSIINLAANWNEWNILLLQAANMLISSSQVKTFMILIHIRNNPQLLIRLLASKLGMLAEAYWGYFLPLEKSSASLEGLGEGCLVTNGLVWYPKNDTKAVYWGEGYQVWPNLLYLGKSGELKSLMLEQLVNNKGCSSIQFLLRVFYQRYKKDLSFIRFFGTRKFHIPNYKNFVAEGGAGRRFLNFLNLGSKGGPATCIYHYLSKYDLVMKSLNHKR